MKFIVDEMLGKLARWLRLAGYDTLYGVKEDAEIAHIANSENRVLLSSDRELCSIVENSVLVKEKDVIKQIREVERTLNIKISPSPDVARCPVCNGEVIEIEKAEVKKDVPENVFKMVDKFYRCVACGKIYWKGSHWNMIKKMIGEEGIERS